ncbi:MAG TPA: hypothetical protein VGK74_01405 [Symbiobacteriaceae bacterium]|jgi:hypothetical protein
MTRFARVMTLVALSLLIGGCQLPPLPWTKSQPAPAPALPAAPVVETVRAETLFPSADWHATYGVQDQGKAEMKVEEDWLRDGQRLVATQNGVPYVTWEFRPDGVWRADPKGFGALLRYLPTLLENDVAWKQESAGREVWFALNEEKAACDTWKSTFPVNQCWQLQVLNRGELTTFLFGRGVGPLRADAVNYARPAESFVKTLRAQKLGTTLVPENRKAVLDKAGGSGAQPAPVRPVTPTEFQQAMQNAKA